MSTSSPGSAAAALIARPSFFQLDNTRKARAQGKHWHLIAHEDVIVLREPLFPGGSERQARFIPGQPAGRRLPDQAAGRAA